jgi:dephospho-CoA kinase
MLKVGITGGIGSGKTTICRIFEILSVPVFNADITAKNIMVSDLDLVEKIKSQFGKETYFDNGDLNRKYLSKIVFNSPDELQKLNRLVHPATIKAFNDWALIQDSHYCLHEAAILFESGAYKSCDYSILVSAPENLRVQRVMKRDGIHEKEVNARINMQMPENEKEKLADFLILNDECTAVIPQVLKLHDFLLKQQGWALF